MKRVIAILMAVCLCFVLCACGNSPSSLVKKYDELVRLESTDEEDWFKREKINEKIRKLQKDLGFYVNLVTNEQPQKCRLDEAFFKKYLKSHSYDEFLESFEIVEDGLYYYLSDCDELFLDMANVVEVGAKVAGYEVKSIDLLNTTTDGYYKTHTEEYPPIETWNVSGRFYDHSGQNGRTEEKECKLERTYYGDFAVECTSGYSYYEGRYEWVNGTFYDELPSWKPYVSYSLIYKGHITVTSGDSMGEIASELSSIKYFEIGEDIVLIHPSSVNHMSPWRRLSNKS